jgi:NADH-quinone oxidoreductase subunit L
MLAPLAVLAVGAVFSGMVWYNSFFGHVDQVARFFGIPYESVHAEAEATDSHAAEDEAATDHAAAATAEEGRAADAARADGYGDNHYVFTGLPGQGAIHFAPDNHVLDEAHAAPVWVKVSPFVAMILGFLLAFQMYIRRPDWPAKLAANQRPLYLFLLNKWYFDEIYDFIIVKPAIGMGRFLWKRGDGAVIDGGINGVALGIVPFFTRLAGRAQSGYIFTYVFAMVIGLAILLTWMTLFGGAE